MVGRIRSQVRYGLDVGAVDDHHVDHAVLAVAVRAEGNLLAVERVLRIVIVAFAIAQQGDFLGGDHQLVDLPQAITVALEDQLGPVGRPEGVQIVAGVGQADFFARRHVDRVEFPVAVARRVVTIQLPSGDHIGSMSIAVVLYVTRRCSVPLARPM